MTIMTTGLPINLSSSVYERFIKGGFLYVDKTLFIEHFLEDASDVFLIPRPRRMGKSLNMNTLAAYLDVKRQTGPLFAGKKIEGWGGFGDHLNRYPVVYMDFRRLKADNYRQAVRSLVLRHVDKYLTGETLEGDLKAFVEDRNNTDPDGLFFLTESLHKVYDKRAVILIDEYDQVLMNNLGSPDYETIRDYISGVFELAFKGNEHLHKALLTGVLRVSQESMFSKLNNVEVYDVFRPGPFDEDFGLTEDEVRGLVPADEFARVKEWYNNIHVGDHWMFYIYSLLSYLKNGRVGDYWGQTGTMELLADQITPARAVKIGEAVKELGASFPAAVDPRVSLRQFFRNEVDEYYYAVAIQGGYLTYEREAAEGDEWPERYRIRVPNRELMHVWRSYILSRIVRDPENRLEKIFAGIDKREFFDQDLAEFISFKLSCFDLGKDHDGRPGGALEKTYHVFVFGMLLTLGYKCRSNREAGFGRFDIFVEAPRWTAALEFKTADDKAGLEGAAREGLKQIHDREYLAEADKGKSAYAIGVGCWKEKCVVITERVW
jgi:hypothetical protein